MFGFGFNQGFGLAPSFGSSIGGGYNITGGNTPQQSNPSQGGGFWGSLGSQLVDVGTGLLGSVSEGLIGKWFGNDGSTGGSTPQAPAPDQGGNDSFDFGQFVPFLTVAAMGLATVLVLKKLDGKRHVARTKVKKRR